MCPRNVPLPITDKEVTVSAVIHAEIPEQLMRQAQRMVERGWAQNVEALVAESLRRYLESHPEELTEQFIRDDVTWGLRGSE
jgi:restriction endonuclease Mrr